MNRILIVEDDEEIAILERDYLEMNGYDVEIVDDGNVAVEKLTTGEYNLAILDVMLPGMTGYEICRKIRNEIDIPIIMVTARGESGDKIRGLGLGADDYIVKPFEPSELVARVKANLSQFERMLRRADRGEQADHMFVQDGKDDYVKVGDLKLLINSWKAYRGEEEIKFANREFELLKFLALNPNIVFSKDVLFERIWGYDYIGDSTTVAVHINRIREKIEEDPANPKIVETIWGAGYRLNN